MKRNIALHALLTLEEGLTLEEKHCRSGAVVGVDQGQVRKHLLARRRVPSREHMLNVQ